MNLIDEFFLEANPNPDRVGCPSEQVIQSLAENRLPLDHPARLHLGICSECFAEFQTYKHEDQVESPSRYASAAKVPPPYTASALESSIPRSRTPNPPEDAQASAPILDRAATSTRPKVVTWTLDFSRENAQTTDAEKNVPTLPKALLALHIVLAPSSEAGPYKLVLTQGPQDGPDSLFSTNGVAVEKRDQVTIEIESDVNLRVFEAGPASLTLISARSGTMHSYDILIG